MCLRKEVSKHREVEGEGDGKRRDGTRVAIQIERMKMEINGRRGSGCGQICKTWPISGKRGGPATKVTNSVGTRDVLKGLVAPWDAQEKAPEASPIEGGTLPTTIWRGMGVGCSFGTYQDLTLSSC